MQSPAHPLPHVSQSERHESVALLPLTPKQLDALSVICGYKKAADYNSLGKAELPCKVQKFLADRIDDGSLTHWLETDGNYEKVASALEIVYPGLSDPRRQPAIVNSLKIYSQMDDLCPAQQTART